MIYQVDETREKIIGEAEKLFLEKGFFETRMKDVAEKAGLSRNSLYRYYRDKSDLAVTIIENIFSRYESMMGESFEKLLSNPTLSGLEKLRESIRRIWIDGEKSPDGKLMAEFDAYYSGSRLTEEMKSKFIRLDNPRYTQRLIALIDEGKRDGSIRPELDSHLTFVTVLNGVRALSQRITLRGDVLVETAEGEIAKMPGSHLDLLMEGLRDRSERHE